MHLQRVQVPDFRVLKDIDISFEKEFSPRIFPLGSLNGGGKSTLLQLIFILLHCSATPEKHEFIRNLLENFEIPDGSNKRVVAEFEIWDGKKAINIEFFTCQDEYLESLIQLRSTQNLSDAPIKLQDWLHKRKGIEDKKEQIISRTGVLQRARQQKDLSSEQPSQPSQEEIELQKWYQDYQTKQTLFSKYLEDQDHNIKYICSCSQIHKNCEVNFSLVCRSAKENKINSFLKTISQKIFLAAPPTQVFLFLNIEYRKLLFKQNKSNKNYYFRTQEAKSKLRNFYPYDTLSINIFIDICKQLRDKDFQTAIETGQYGNNYQSFLKDINILLIDKKINIDKDLLGINFKTEKNGQTTELYPEDLSHGELKRLSLYVWLKYSNTENAIILFDEIEIALHPDWQYQIIRDLEEWGPTNQYILATHSHELCQALTPAHVKEIEPKLLNNVNHS
jgi:predicted ATPase